MASTYTLAQIRSDVQIPVGDRAGDLTSDYFDRRINDAIKEIAFRVQPDELQTISTSIVWATSTRSYSLTALDPLVVLGVKDTTNDRLLAHLELEQFESLDEDETGQPEYWNRFAGNLRVWPLPSATYAGSATRLSYIAKPTTLSADGDTSPLPEFLDRAIVEYARFLCYNDLNEPERAGQALAVFVGIIQGKDAAAAAEYAAGAHYGWPGRH